MKSLIYKLSALLILFSAIGYMFIPHIATYIMAFSVVVFTVITATTPYPGKSIRGKRLFNFQIFSCVMMIIATYLMFKQRNEWVLAMIVGAIFMLYAAVMIPKEIEKENNRFQE